MNILSLFDGMSCGRLALDRLGIKVDKYYASEIDKYAIEVSSANYPDTIQIGDVCDVKGEDYPDIDLILGGSPCQGFSFAGHQLAFDDPRSALFFEFVRVLKEVNPKYFLLENVKMKKEFLDIISDQVGVEPILINSSLLSAQNRQRYYWTNIPGVEQPEDRGLVLKDILETEADEQPTKDPERNRRHHKTPEQKSLTMTATMYKGAGNNGMTLVPLGKPQRVGTANIKGHDSIKRVYSQEGKSPTLTTMQGGHRQPKVAIEKNIAVDEEKKQLTIREATKKGYTVIEDGDCFDATHINSKTRRGRNMKHKSNALTAGNYDYRRFKIRNKSKTVRSGGRGSYDRHEWDSVDEMHWRKLTPLECERLQTVPDNYTNHVSNTQRYKMLGNGWTVEVIAHILRNME
jgi:DNA-cytosine methyltransferase